MAIKKVIQIGDPLLRKKCVRVNNFNAPEIKTIKSGLKGHFTIYKKFIKRESELVVLLIGNTVTSLFENI